MHSTLLTMLTTYIAGAGVGACKDVKRWTNNIAYIYIKWENSLTEVLSLFEVNVGDDIYYYYYCVCMCPALLSSEAI